MNTTRFHGIILLKSLVVGSVLVPVLAQAHPGHFHAGDFQSGFLHPLFGIDHLVALLAVGLWALRLGGSRRWVMPLTALASLAIGTWAAGAASNAGIFEFMIVVSLIFLGVVVGFARHSSTTVSVLAVSGFMIFHGMAHGAEMALGAGGSGVSRAGLLLASSGIMAVGYFAGSVFQTARPARARRLFAASGAAISLCGVVCALV